MEQAGEYRIATDRENVWAGLNDPDVLARCIDGCQSMTKLDDTTFEAKVKAKVGPVRATFAARLELTDVDPPNRYTINANVKGGPAGFGKGSAQVMLEPEGEQTLLRYTAAATVGGKLAQIGSRLIDAAARKMADDFFAAFKQQLEPAESLEEAVTEGAGSEGEGQHGEPEGQVERNGQWKVWVVVFGVFILTLILVL